MVNSPIIPSNTVNLQTENAKKSIKLTDSTAINSFLANNYPDQFCDYANYVDHFLAGGIMSRAKDSTPKLELEQCQELCVAYVVASFIKTVGATCTALNSTITAKYNKVCSYFSVKPVSDVKNILTRCYKSKLLTSVKDRIQGVFVRLRKITINRDVLETYCPSSEKTAASRAKSKANKKNYFAYEKIFNGNNLWKTCAQNEDPIFFDQNQEVDRLNHANPNMSIENIELAEIKMNKLGSRIENRSSKEERKDLKKANNKFDYSRIHIEKAKYQELEAKYQQGSSTNEDLFMLAQLKFVNNIKMPDTFLGWLRRIAHVNAAKSALEAFFRDCIVDAFPTSTEANRTPLTA